MTKTNALPRPVGATVLSLLAIALAAIALPASSLAAPPDGAAPQLALLTSATLPTTTVGYQSQTQELVVVNEGEGEAFVNKAFLAGDDAGEFNLGGTNCNGAVLQQGQQCSAWVSFMPGNSGERHVALAIELSDRPTVSFPLSATGAAPHLRFDPSSYDFGLQPIHSETMRTTFQLENDGAAGTQVNSLGFAGGNSNGFWIGNSNCYGAWLEAGQSCSVEVNFGPGEVGSYALQLQAGSDGQYFNADLTAEAGRPIVEASPNPADLGAATVGSTGAIQTIVISNSGNVPTGFFIGIIAGGDSGSFQLLGENCTFAPLMPAGSCTAQVRFRPQSAGPKSAHLAFFGDSEGGTMVALTGEGVAPAVTLVPSSYDFGAEASGSKGDGHAFAVRNEGGSALELGSVAIAGTDLDQFPLTGDDCTGATLAPGDECLVRVRFAPYSAGAKAAKLRVGSDSGTFTAPLRGLGTDAGSPGQAQAGQAQAAPGGPPPPPRHRVRHRRRFVRGGDVVVGRAQRRARAEARADLGPR
jgi:hypothetical protein